MFDYPMINTVLITIMLIMLAYLLVRMNRIHQLEEKVAMLELRMTALEKEATGR
jgi:hypothetical protein